MHIDFNADIGEGCGDDAAIVPLLSSASIACGGHAGDAASMAAAVACCAAHGVAIGAHPSWEDRPGFGRQRMDRPAAELQSLLRSQVQALAAVAAQVGMRLAHVKPHGALYNQAAEDAGVADAIAGEVARIDPGLKLYALAGSELAAAGRRAGLAVVEEVFAERGYRSDGRLVPRGEPGAVIDTLDTAVAQTLQMLAEGSVTSVDGKMVPIHPQTLCLHGDRPDAAAFARGLREAIEAAGYAVRAPD
ncbi:LamB/YcsF family protein [Alkalisalibacterium limincola]|uniref:LamB/YcsF family protein n=2 Tax=Alkalisalibacterium limincola TaxID=2699169 RepID=A0A5C8KRT4_9GAMM|nr:LamB/YcsF family protein [Alkalisalibacterium limincola]